MKYLFLFLSVAVLCNGEVKHKRDGTNLPLSEKEFSEQLSIKLRKIFCGQFNPTQRELAIKYAEEIQEGMLTPDDAVIKVMEETGMSLSLKGRPN